jgi:hypothetical protein
MTRSEMHGWVRRLQGTLFPYVARLDCYSFERGMSLATQDCDIAIDALDPNMAEINRMYPDACTEPVPYGGLTRLKFDFADLQS